MDGEVDGSLAHQLAQMGTNDRDVILQQFRQLIGGHLDRFPETGVFFLEMCNWVLSDAVDAYFDFGMNGASGSAPQFITRLPSVQFVMDVTIGEGESIPPNTCFKKSWRFKNTGDELWPFCHISFMEGCNLSANKRFWVGTVEPDCEIDISVEMYSPAERGIYSSRWQLTLPNGIPFGESIWCIITVDDFGLLDITQKLASVPLGAPIYSSPCATATESMLTDSNQIVDESMENIEFDRPSTPYGSSSLYAVVERLPPIWQLSQGDGSREPISEPINCASMDQSPEAPPSSPCTPPQ